MKQIIIFVFCLIGYCTSFVQEATYYLGPNCTGESLTIQSKRADLHALSPEFHSNHKSRAFLGRWKGYREKDFLGISTGGDFYETKTCEDGYAPGVSGSVRFLGPLETETESITLYRTAHYVGPELIIDRQAYALVGFEIGSFIISPGTSWTLYSEDNFNGTAICVSSSFDKYALYRGTSILLQKSMKSVLKGCKGPKIDAYHSL